MNYSWVPMMGLFNDAPDGVIFKGTELEDTSASDATESPGGSSKEKKAMVGQALCSETFAEGTVATDVTFAEGNDRPLAEIVLFYDPSSRSMITAGLGWSTAGGMFAVRQWNGKMWSTIAVSGAVANLKMGRAYRVRANLRGSFVSLSVDGVDVLSTNVPAAMSESQIGVFCIGTGDITFANFTVQKEEPKVFVVMQYTPQYDELYTDVIKPVCDELKLKPQRADETHAPGLVIADIIRQIVESKVIVAEITPANPNVYYEVGFAHALNKPTILIADKGTKLPFDVSPFRTLFYENSIGGKKRVEEGLRKYLNSILSFRSVINRNPL